jgi:hypothetical protein
VPGARSSRLVLHPATAPQARHVTEIHDDRPIVRPGILPGVLVPSGHSSPPAVSDDGGSNPAGDAAPHGDPDESDRHAGGAFVRSHACTAAQLRRFIKSRPYVPLHELRRRFELIGETDEVSRLETSGGPAYVGLPERESALLQELLRQGEIGVELSVDPDVAVVVGVFPMRPVPRI